MRIGRTSLIVAFVLGLLAWTLSADAQQPTKIARVGILSDVTPVLAAKLYEPPFARGLQELGWVVGQNIAFEGRYAEGKSEILPSLATELVRLQPDVILAIGITAAVSAKSATQTIPVVFVRTADPIGSGLVLSLARPGGNLTGLSDQMVETSAKRLELLVTAAPNAKRVGVLWNSDYPPSGPELAEIERAAHSLDREVIPVDVRALEGFEPALRAMAEQRAGALIVVPGTVFAEHFQRIAELTANIRLPAMGFSRRFVEAGGLMSYAPDEADRFRRAATYVDKILKGAKPADLPVEQPTKFELVINLKTAKALGLTLPYTLLGRADEVIE
jgi:putative tryptophan/tyrosine transport system substrate-binding protein